MSKSVKDERAEAIRKINEFYDDVEKSSGEMSLYDMEVLAEKEAQLMKEIALRSLAVKKTPDSKETRGTKKA